MKNKCAVFTIVKNENYNIFKWINHYKKYFDVKDIFILNHQTDDGSTDNLSVNVIEVVNELAFDHQWLVDTVQSFQQKLLNDYECVIFAEADELLYSPDKPLNETINDFLASDDKYITCKGYDIIQSLIEEKALTLDDDIFQFRSFWYPNSMYDKTLISKIPLNWAWGFHTISLPTSYKYNIHMAHLHRVDLELMFKRHQERATKWNLKNDGSSGFHHRIGDREGVEKFFKDIPTQLVCRIPENHKQQLYGL